MALLLPPLVGLASGDEWLLHEIIHIMALLYLVLPGMYLRQEATARFSADV